MKSNKNFEHLFYICTWVDREVVVLIKSIKKIARMNDRIEQQKQKGNNRKLQYKQLNSWPYKRLKKLEADPKRPQATNFSH